MYKIEKLYNGIDIIDTITLKNEYLDVVVTNIGACLLHLSLKEQANCIVRYHDSRNYILNDVYLGAAVGPLAGRIKGNRIDVDATCYELSHENDAMHLHGGKYGISHQIFNYEVYNDDEPMIVLSLDVDHTLDGYPGSVFYEIIYRLEKDTLITSFNATPSVLMPINMTQHVYFNMNQTNTLEAHRLYVNADKYAPLSEDMTSEGLWVDVTDTPFDFRGNPLIMDCIRMDHDQFRITRNIDHSLRFVENIAHQVTLQGLNTCLCLETSTATIHLYTANFFDQSFVNEWGTPASNYSAIALEPQGLSAHNELQYYDQNNPYHEIHRYTLKPV